MQEIKRKERVVKDLSQKYQTTKISQDDIKFCLYSLTDNNSFLNSNSEPIQQMLDFLTTFFPPTVTPDPEHSLAIVAGENGARLTHTHENQLNYVQQSLMLWKEIMDNMFMLWFLAEDDLLNPNLSYKLGDTGQGTSWIFVGPRS